MPPYFTTVKSFAAVPVTDNGVDTVTFLEASEGVVGIFDLLGSTAFSPVISDLKGNILKVRTRYLSHPTVSTTLETLVVNEQTEKKRVATEGLLWLLRGLSFTCQALQVAQTDKSMELDKAFTKGYEGSLKAHHNFVVKGIFAMAMKACPYRKDFYNKLAHNPDGGQDAPLDTVHAELDQWLAALSNIVKRMEVFYQAGGYGKGF